MKIVVGEWFLEKFMSYAGMEWEVDPYETSSKYDKNSDHLNAIYVGNKDKEGEEWGELSKQWEREEQKKEVKKTQRKERGGGVEEEKDKKERKKKEYS